jgi:hypothetical protein
VHNENCYELSFPGKFIVFPYILPHLKIYLSADSLPHEKNYLKRWTMTSSTPGATLGERGVEDGAKHGDKERVE